MSLFPTDLGWTQQSFHLLLAILKRKLYWPFLTLSQGGDYISQKLTIFVSKLTHQNFNTVLSLNWKAVISELLPTIDLSVMYFAWYFGDKLFAITVIFSVYNYCMCKPEENLQWIFTLYSGTERSFAQRYHRFACLYPLLHRETVILHHTRHAKLWSWFLQDQEEDLRSPNSTCHWASPNLGAKSMQDMSWSDPELILLGVTDSQNDFHRHGFPRCQVLVHRSTIPAL